MRIGTKVMFAIILAVVLSITGVTLMVSPEMNKAFIANFEISSKSQLERMNAFVENFLVQQSQALSCCVTPQLLWKI